MSERTDHRRMQTQTMKGFATDDKWYVVLDCGHEQIIYQESRPKKRLRHCPKCRAEKEKQ